MKTTGVCNCLIGVMFDGKWGLIKNTFAYFAIVFSSSTTFLICSEEFNMYE